MSSLLKSFALIVFLVSITVSNRSANAALIQADYLISNDNGAVFDTDSGLTWLGLDKTTGLSYIDAGQFDKNYRYATYLEVEELFSQFDNAEYLPIGIAPNVSGELKVAALSFASLFGANLGSFSYGLYNNESGILNYAGVYTAGTNIIGTGWDFNYEIFRASGNSAFSTYLVKVNEPQTFVMLMLGFIVAIRLKNNTIWRK